MRNQDIPFFDTLKCTYFSVIQLVEKNEQNIYIVGDNRSGKTTILNKLNSYFQAKDKYSSLLLIGKNNQRDYDCFYTALKNIGSKRNLGSELIKNIEIEKFKLPAQLASFLMKIHKNRINYNVFHLNDIEKEIIYRIKLLKKKSQLLIFIDNFDLLDDSSKKILHFISSKKAKLAFKFLEDITIIATTKSIYNLQIDSVDSKEVIINAKLNRSDYFETFKFIEESIIYELYKITNGRIGLTQDILNEVNKDELSEILKEDMLNYTDTIFKTLRKRLNNVIEDQIEIEDVLKRASVIGDTFSYLYLIEICKQEEFQLKRTLKKAEKEAFISNLEHKGYFTSEYIFRFFSSIVDEYQTEYNYEMANALKKLKSRDYFSRYHHLKLAKKREDSVEALIVYMLTNYIHYDLKPNPKLEKDICDSLYYKEVYLPLIEALNLYKLNEPKEKVFSRCKENVLIDSSLLMVEHTYVFCYLLYKLGDQEDFHKCDSLITNILQSGLEIDADQWFRLSILLLLLYINRLDMFDRAKELYTKITIYFVKNSKDRSVRYYQYYLKLLSPALDTLELSKIELIKALEYFKQQFPRYRNEYIRGLTNLSGVYLYSSEYKEGFLKSSEALELIEDSSFEFEKKERIISNFLLCGLYSDQLYINEVLKEYEIIVPAANRSSNALFKNNYIVLKALSGDVSNSFVELLDLYREEKRDEYYSFLLGSNVVVLAIVNNNIELATEIFENINGIVPAISNYEKYEIEQRYAGINQLLLSDRQVSLDQVEEFFKEQLSKNISRYWKKSLLVTDFQYWS
ncbi:hypothetical protein [Enterococcus sp. AZ192]|uniref:hypothetical protein n=1 Tax=unclassified Enterococcus TaxID=2608891 RepID=UPI003D26F7E6